MILDNYYYSIYTYGRWELDVFIDDGQQTRRNLQVADVHNGIVVGATAPKRVVLGERGRHGEAYEDNCDFHGGQFTNEL